MSLIQRIKLGVGLDDKATCVKSKIHFNIFSLVSKLMSHPRHNASALIV